MSSIDLDFDEQQLRRVVMDLAATEDQVKKALSSTVSKMARWMRTQSVRGLSKKLQVQQKLIRSRLRNFNMRSTSDGDFSIKIWYGLNPIDFMYLNPRKTSKGVKAKKREIEGGFIAPVRGGNKVFKRVGQKRRMTRGNYIGQIRQPIEKQYAPIADEAQIYIEDEVIGTDEFEKEFFKIFERELRWRTSKS